MHESFIGYIFPIFFELFTSAAIASKKPETLKFRDNEIFRLQEEKEQILFYDGHHLTFVNCRQY